MSYFFHMELVEGVGRLAVRSFIFTTRLFKNKIGFD